MFCLHKRIISNCFQLYLNGTHQVELEIIPHPIINLPLPVDGSMYLIEIEDGKFSHTLEMKTCFPYCLSEIRLIKDLIHTSPKSIIELYSKPFCRILYQCIHICRKQIDLLRDKP